VLAPPPATSRSPARDARREGLLTQAAALPPAREGVKERERRREAHGVGEEGRGVREKISPKP